VGDRGRGHAQRLAVIQASDAGPIQTDPGVVGEQGPQPPLGCQIPGIDPAMGAADHDGIAMALVELGRGVDGEDRHIRHDRPPAA
jgi:hypothetical protein